MTASSRTPQHSRPVLSVLIPFYRDDPAALVLALDGQAVAASSPVEIVLCDDGSADAGLTRKVEATLSGLSVRAWLISKAANEGRAAARNSLAAAATGEWLLFLDADMTVPDGFLQRWLIAIDDGAFDAAFGGFSADAPASAAERVHAAIAEASDTGGAASRQQRGASAFCTSNLLVRSDLMPSLPFDDSFKGWGWEDVDWAVRAARVGRLHHIDNPAGHHGWQSVEQLLDRYREAAANYARLLSKHPELAGLPGARVARSLGALPGQSALRGLWRSLARSEGTPMRIRTLALKLWRASWAAEAMPR